MYPTDLKDSQWTLIEPYFPQRSWTGRPRIHSYRQIVNAIFYLIRSGCAWRMLPKDYPNWKTVYYYFCQWRMDGTWEKLNTELTKMDRQRSGKKPLATAAAIDTQSVKTTEIKGERGYDANKKIKGRKRHILVDTQGHLLQVVVHPANLQDNVAAPMVFDRYFLKKNTLQLIWADGIYTGPIVELAQKSYNWVLKTVKRKKGEKGFQPLPRRWVVERTFAWIGRYRRLSKDFEVLAETSENMIYACMVHFLLRRLA